MTQISQDLLDSYELHFSVFTPHLSGHACNDAQLFLIIIVPPPYPHLRCKHIDFSCKGEKSM